MPSCDERRLERAQATVAAASCSATQWRIALHVAAPSRARAGRRARRPARQLVRDGWVAATANGKTKDTLSFSTVGRFTSRCASSSRRTPCTSVKVVSSSSAPVCHEPHREPLLDRR